MMSDMPVRSGLVGTVATGVVVGGALLAAALGGPADPVHDGSDRAALVAAVDPRLQALLALAWWLPAAALHWRRPLLPFWKLALPASLGHAAASLAMSWGGGGEWPLWLASWLILVELPLLGALVQLFPTGHPLPRWRGYLLASLTSGAAGIVAAALEQLPTLGDDGRATAGLVAIPLLAFSAVGCVVPLVARVLHTVGSERSSSIWVLVVVTLGLGIPPLVAGGSRWSEVVAQVFTAGQLALITVAVLRHRVWGLTAMLPGSLSAVVAATDTERRRLRAELHDGLGGGLAAARMKVDAAQRLLTDRPQRAREVLGSVSEDIGVLIEETRRLTEGLRPAALDRLGLAHALHSYADDLAGHGLEVRIDAAGLPPLSPAIEDVVYRVVGEALHNVVRHAQAQHCQVGFEVRDHELTVVVSDDGAMRSVRNDDSRTGLGLSTMAGRAAAVGGYVVAGHEPAGGFTVRAIVPRIEP